MFIGALLLAAQMTDAAATPLERLQARFAVQRLDGKPGTLPGRYTTASAELGSHWGGGHLSGEELHLFADGSYVYCEWADIEPLTVYDRGTWELDGDLVRLRSGPEVSWSVSADRTYVALQRAGHRNDALLVGVERALPRLEELPDDDDPGFTLLLGTFLRDQRYSAKDGSRTRAALLKAGWRPDYFRKPQ